MEKTSGKVAYLDGLRGVAALFVFFHHFLLTFYSAYFTFDPAATNLHNLDIQFGQSVFSVFANGRFCVEIFFVLSGYVLSRKYFRENDPGILVSAAQRRFIRLYVPVAFVLLFSYLLMRCGFYYNVPVSKLTHSEWWLGSFWTFDNMGAKLWQCLTLGTMFLGDSSFDNSMWTMCIELYGSLLVFAMLALTHNSRNRLAIMALLYLFFAFTGREDYTAFLLGISLNYSQHWLQRVSRYVRVLIVVTLVAAALVLGSVPAKMDMSHTLFQNWPSELLVRKDWMLIYGAYFMVLAFVLSPQLQAFISKRVFRFLGYISFSFYLLHPVVLGSFSCFAFLQVQPHMSYNRAVLLVFVLTTAVTLPASWLMARYVDAPGMRFSKYVYDRWIRR
jgi:peptidoglycan/LPS O-acetylase OafA/YrhL